MTAPAELALPRAQHTRGVWLMLLSTACFTANVLLIRAVGAFQSVDIWLVSGARFAIGIGVLLALYRRETQFRRVFTRINLAGRGLIGGLGVAVYYVTVVHLGAGRATFINNTYVIFGALGAVAFLHEPFRRALAVGSVGALLGLALLTNAFTQGAQAGRWDALAIASALASAYVVVTIRVLHAEGEHTATIFAAQCVYGVLVCAVPAALHYAPVSAGAWGLMITAGLCAAAGQLAMTAAFRHLPVGQGSLLQMLVPLGIAIGGATFFHEHFAVHELLGAALILGGTVLTVARR